MRFIGIGQCGTRHATVKAHMVKLAAQRSQASLDVAKTIPISQLGKRHRQILVPTREAAWPRISAVSSYATAKITIRQEAQQLRENGSTLIHASLCTIPDSAIGDPATFQIAASQMGVQLSARKALASSDSFISRTVMIFDQLWGAPASVEMRRA